MTSIRHNRFTNTLLIEHILSEIELIVREIDRGSIDEGLAESELRVAASHLGRLQNYLPSDKYHAFVSSVQQLITQLQNSRERCRHSRFRSRLCHSGRPIYL